MTKIYWIKDIVFPVLTVVIFTILQVLFTGINQYIFMFMYVFVYVMMLLNNKISLFIIYILLAIVIDSIHNIAVGTTILVFSIYSSSHLIFNHLLSKISFMHSYILGLILNVLIISIIGIFNFITTIHFVSITLFIASFVILYPIIYFILTFIYNPNAK